MNNYIHVKKKKKKYSVYAVSELVFIFILFFKIFFFLNFKLLSDDEIPYLFTCDALSIQYLLLYRCWINTMKAVKK